jgi:hypothetical protein
MINSLTLTFLGNIPNGTSFYLTNIDSGGYGITVSPMQNQSVESSL